MKLAIFLVATAAIRSAVAGNITCFTEGPSFDSFQARQGATLVVNKLCGPNGLFTNYFKKDMLKKSCEHWTQLMDDNPPVPGQPPFLMTLKIHMEVKSEGADHGVWLNSRACRDHFWHIMRSCPRGGYTRYVPIYGGAPGTGLNLHIWHRPGMCEKHSESDYLKHDHHDSDRVICKPPFYDQQRCQDA